MQFEEEMIKRKVALVINTTHKYFFPNVYSRRIGHTLTPLMTGKIQYAKLKKISNMDAIKSELRACELTYTNDTIWTTMTNAIKAREGDNKFFTPSTNYDSLK